MPAKSGSPEKISITVKASDKTNRLDLFLSEHKKIELSRNQIQKLIDNGKVLVNSEPANKKYQVQVKDKIKVEIPPRFAAG